MYRIEHTENLWGLAALPLLVAALWLLLSWKKQAVARIGDPSLVRQLISNFSSTRFLIKAAVLLLAFLVIVIGAGNPQKTGKMENVKRKGVDVMIVLDVSKSMLATDVKPSRLDKAKELLLLMIDKLENDRIGLVLFAGRAYLQMPLTSDHGAARMYIQDASPDAVPTQGTVIAEALRMANSAFNSKERKYKSILLISDGEDHDPDALKVAKELARDGVMINTVGIGSPEGSPIVDPATGELKKDEQGNTVISKLNEAELQQLSNATNGQYIRLDNVDDALITMTQQIDSVDKKSMSDAEFVDYISYFQWFLGIAVLFLVFDYFFSERRSAASEKRERAASGASLGLTASATNSTGASGPGSNSPATGSHGASAARPGVAGAATLLALAILVSAFPATAQNPNGQIRSGNRAYKKGEFEKSVQQYQRAVRQAPNNPTANYNLGNAQFKNNKFDEAAHDYDATVQNSTDKTMKEKGYYNKGVAMIRQKKLQESIDAWKNALKLDAGDTEARDNLEKALKEQKKQQQQQQQQQQNQKKDKKNQDKQDQKKEQQQQQQQQQQQPKPQPSKLDKQQVEQLLKALEQKEKDLHDKMQQNRQHTPNQPEKDW